MELRGRGWSILAAAREVGISENHRYNWSRGYKTYRNGVNRAGFDAASVFVKDADHAQALPTRAA